MSSGRKRGIYDINLNLNRGAIKGKAVLACTYLLASVALANKPMSRYERLLQIENMASVTDEVHL